MPVYQRQSKTHKFCFNSTAQWIMFIGSTNVRKGTVLLRTNQRNFRGIHHYPVPKLQGNPEKGDCLTATSFTHFPSIFLAQTLDGISMCSSASQNAFLHYFPLEMVKTDSTVKLVMTLFNQMQPKYIQFKLQKQVQ